MISLKAFPQKEKSTKDEIHLIGIIRDYRNTTTSKERKFMLI